MKYRKKPIVIEATQWFKNGDHPADYEKEEHGFEDGKFRAFSSEERKAAEWEGSVVRYFRHPEMPGDQVCEQCSETLFEHGFIDTLEGGHRVCPGDFIITGIKGERYPCKPDIFAATYEDAAMFTPAPSGDRLRKAAMACDVAMETAAAHNVFSILPPTYRDSWAQAHMELAAALAGMEGR